MSELRQLILIWVQFAAVMVLIAMTVILWDHVHEWLKRQVNLTWRYQQVLVLTRKRQESIMIGDNIRIVLIDIRGEKARIGIEAPQDVTVNRQEVHDAIKAREWAKEHGAKDEES